MGTPSAAVETVVNRPTTIERAKDGFFYVEAHVADVPVRFLVDTGASATVLSAKDARRLGLVAAKHARVRTVGGDVAMAATTLDKLDLAGRKLAHVDALVAPGSGPSLIGQRVLAQFASVTMRGDTMRFD